MDDQCGARSATKEAASGDGQLNCARQDVVAFVRQPKAGNRAAVDRRARGFLSDRRFRQALHCSDADQRSERDEANQNSGQKPNVFHRASPPRPAPYPSLKISTLCCSIAFYVHFHKALKTSHTELGGLASEIGLPAPIECRLATIPAARASGPRCKLAQSDAGKIDHRALQRLPCQVAGRGERPLDAFHGYQMAGDQDDLAHYLALREYAVVLTHSRSLARDASTTECHVAGQHRAPSSSS